MAKKNPLYKKNGRFYADFRSYSDVGGGQEAMIPEDERYATKNYRTAKRLAKERRAELRGLRKAGLKGEGGDLRIPGGAGQSHQGHSVPVPDRPDRPVGSIKRLVGELALRIDYDGNLTPKI